MRKLIFAIFLLSILLSSQTWSDDSLGKVDTKVIQEIAQDDTVGVIITLSEDLPIGISSSETTEDIIDDVNIEKEAEFEQGFSTEINTKELIELEQDPRIEKIEFNYPIKLLLEETVDIVNASLTWQQAPAGNNIDGSGQAVCIIDTGVNYTHPDLGGCLGTNCKVVGGHDFVSDDEDPLDDQGHGTHVAGIIASNNTITSGIAPNASIVSIKVLDDNGTGYTSDLISGLEWCINNATAFNINTISLSLGTANLFTTNCDSTYNTQITGLVNDAISNNISVIAASGNDGSITGVSAPSCIINSTSVGSTDKSDSISSFTNRNSLVDLLAPGESINSTSYTGGYEIRSGTSMATPVVAAAFALLNQYYNDSNISVSPAIIKQELQETGISIYDSSTQLSFPRIDIIAALTDTAAPTINITVPSTVELNDNVTISITPEDAFLDSYHTNITYPNETLILENSTSSSITLSLTDLGTYTITTYANDTSGNENTTTETFILQDSSGLNPSSFTFNNFASNENTTKNLTAYFNFTIGSKYNLTNATLYHNLTSWHANQTTSLSDNETTLYINSNFSDGIYNIGVEACDLNNYCNFSNNQTLFVDTTDPNVTLTSPVNHTNFTSLAAVDLTFNVEDLAIPSCTLIFNGTTNETLTTINANGSNTFSEDFYYIPDGDYTWKVSCTDKADHIANSSAFNFNVACTSDFSTPINSYSACQDNDTKHRTFSDANFCVNSTLKTETAFDSCDTTTDDDSSSSSSSSGGSGGGSSLISSTTQESSLGFTAKVGAKKTLTISKDVGLDKISLTLKNSVSSGKITVKKLDSKPTSTTSVSNVYKYIEIEKTGFENTDLDGNAELSFKVPLAWVKDNANNDPTKIVLKRFTTTWETLETLTAGIDGTDQKFIAYTPGFSYFAISSLQQGEVEPDLIALSPEANATVNETEVQALEGITGGVINTLKFDTKLLTNQYALIAVFALLGLVFLGEQFRLKTKKSNKKDKHEYTFKKEKEVTKSSSLKFPALLKSKLGSLISTVNTKFKAIQAKRTTAKAEEQKTKETKNIKEEKALKFKEKSLNLQEKKIELKELEDELAKREHNERLARQRLKEQKTLDKKQPKTKNPESWKSFDLDDLDE